MILADTSIWIEFLKKNAPIFTEFKILLEQQQIVAVEWIFGELLQGAKTTREQRTIRDYWENIPHLDYAGIWIEAGLLSATDRLFDKGIGLIDAAIIVAAQKAPALIWTLDKKLLNALKTENIYKFPLTLKF